MGEFNTAIGDGNKFQELLLKIFKKKVKRHATRLGHAPNPTSQPTPSTGEAAAQGPEGADDEYNSEEEEDDEDDDR